MDCDNETCLIIIGDEDIRRQNFFLEHLQSCSTAKDKEIEIYAEKNTSKAKFNNVKKL